MYGLESDKKENSKLEICILVLGYLDIVTCKRNVWNLNAAETASEFELIYNLATPGLGKDILCHEPYNHGNVNQCSWIIYCKSLIFSEFSVFDLNAKLKGR